MISLTEDMLTIAEETIARRDREIRALEVELRELRFGLVKIGKVASGGSCGLVETMQRIGTIARIAEATGYVAQIARAKEERKV